MEMNERLILLKRFENRIFQSYNEESSRTENFKLLFGIAPL